MNPSPAVVDWWAALPDPATEPTWPDPAPEPLALF